MPKLTPEAAAIIEAGDRFAFKVLGGLGRIFGSLAAKNEEAYWYAVKGNNVGYIDLTAVIGNVATGVVDITQEADFVANRLTFEAVNPVSGAVIANTSWTAKIKDGGSDRDMMPFEVHVNALMGTAQRCVPFAKNRLFRRNSTVTIDFTNLQAVATRIYIAIWGYKIYDTKALDLTRRR